MPRWGVTGAGLGWALRCAADSIVLLFLANRAAPVRLWSQLRAAAWGPFLLCVAAGVLGAVGQRALTGGVERTAATAVAVTLLGAGAWRLALSPEERGQLKRVLGAA